MLYVRSLDISQGSAVTPDRSQGSAVGHGDFLIVSVLWAVFDIGAMASSNS